MTAQEFCYWLQGHFELNGPKLTEEQVKIVQDHLKLVFNKVTPDYVWGPYDPIISKTTDFNQYLRSDEVYKVTCDAPPKPDRPQTIVIKDGEYPIASC